MRPHSNKGMVGERERRGEGGGWLGLCIPYPINDWPEYPVSC